MTNRFLQNLEHNQDQRGVKSESQQDQDLEFEQGPDYYKMILQDAKSKNKKNIKFCQYKPNDLFNQILDPSNKQQLSAKLVNPLVTEFLKSSENQILPGVEGRLTRQEVVKLEKISLKCENKKG